MSMIILVLGSVRKEMSQTPHGTSQRDHSGIAFREFVDARHDPSVLFCLLWGKGYLVQKAQAKLLVPQKASQLLIAYLASSTILEWVSLQESLMPMLCRNLLIIPALLGLWMQGQGISM